jgi:hypothetical protein
LTSRWIASNKLDNAQIQSILLSLDRKIPTRLRQVAAWLVASDPHEYGWLVPRDPEAFVLNIDIPDDHLKSELVAALLTEVRAGRLYHDYSLNLTSLRHGGLAEQLHSALREPKS